MPQIMPFIMLFTINAVADPTLSKSIASCKNYNSLLKCKAILSVKWKYLSPIYLAVFFQEPFGIKNFDAGLSNFKLLDNILQPKHIVKKIVKSKTIL